MIERVRLMWSILRGRPTAYRITIRHGGFDLTEAKKARVTECAVFGAAVGMSVQMPPGLELFPQPCQPTMDLLEP